MNTLWGKPTDKVIFRLASSYRHVLSSVVGTFTNYLERNFPKDYFREFTINTSSALGRYVIKSSKEGSSNTHVRFTEMPALGVQVNEIGERSEYAIGSEWHKNIQMGVPDEISMFLDYENLREIKPFLDRAVINFTVVVVEESAYRAYDTMSYINRMLPMGRKAYLNKAVIGFQIPNDLIQYIAKTVNLDLKDKDQLTEFKNYMYTCSRGAVTTSFDGGSGLEIFVYKYQCNIVMQLSDAATTDIRTQDNTVKSAAVQFQVQLDLSVISGLVFYEMAKYADPSTETFIVNDRNKPYVSFPVASYPSIQIDNTDKSSKLELTYYVQIITDVEAKESDDTDLKEFLPDVLIKKWKEVGELDRKLVLFQGYKKLEEGVTVSDDLILSIKYPALLRGAEYQIGIYINGLLLTADEWATLKDHTPFLSP